MKLFWGIILLVTYYQLTLANNTSTESPKVNSTPNQMTMNEAHQSEAKPKEMNKTVIKSTFFEAYVQTRKKNVDLTILLIGLIVTINILTAVILIKARTSAGSFLLCMIAPWLLAVGVLLLMGHLSEIFTNIGIKVAKMRRAVINIYYNTTNGMTINDKEEKDIELFS